MLDVFSLSRLCGGDQAVRQRRQDAIKGLIVVLLCFAPVVSVLVGGSCAGNGEGALPTREVGDQWVYDWVVEAVEHTCTIEGTDEGTVAGKECYVADWWFDLPLHDGLMETARTAVDKATCQVRQTWGQGLGPV